MALSAQTPAVPQARPGPITDQILEQAIAVARGAQDADRLSDDGAALILWIAAPALEELLQWRRRMRVIADVATADNVILMPGARA